MSVVGAIDEGVIGRRLWLYSNYHCNLACTYCLTDSAPRAARRLLSPEEMLAAADDAVALGFTALGVTGGEPFLLSYLPDLLAALAERLPVVVLSNGTLFGPRLLGKMARLAGSAVAIQISLDSAEPDANDAARGPGNFADVVAAIPRLIDLGIPVRIATTGGDPDPTAMAKLCHLHRALGVPDDDHVVRPIVRRGRAAAHGLGVVAEPGDLPPELTVTADGAFWSPFAPTVREGRLDTDLLLVRTTQPLRIAAEAMVRVAEGRSPDGSDTTLNIR